jgi:nucleoside-diphosphate-sugar epimerase
VAHTGHSLVGVGAEPANPEQVRGAYARTKAAAERHALAANGHELAVVAIRPHLVWGPGDPQLIDRVVARARAGRLVLVGTGAALVDTTYVDNAADALVAALDRAAEVGGQALVVTNGEPRPIAELLSRICAAAGVAGPRRRVPAGLAYAAGGLNEAIWAVRDRVRPAAGDPPLTRFLIEQMSTAHWFDQRHTRSALGWAPRISLDQGFATLAASYRC